MAKKNRVTEWDILVWFLLFICAYGLYYTNILRANIGYFEDGTLIFWNSFFYITFFGLFTGYVISRLLSFVKK